MHGQELASEQEAVLSEILAIVRERRIDALVHAGDVFDSANPPASALKLYYSFLARLVQTGCGVAIITGGNHDSPAALNAPKSLLEAINIRVVGGATEDIHDEIIPIRNAAGETLGYCAAAPFLRDKDLRYSVPGETESERSRRIVEGIRLHYERLAQAAAEQMKRDNNEGLPLFATGHLFAQGGVTGDADAKERIHVGNLGQIGADAFPDAFSYVALGHLHRPQIVGKREHIRYAGSPVALDFSERDDAKQILLAEWRDGASTPLIESLSLQSPRRLARFSGTDEEIEQALHSFDAGVRPLATFAEICLVPGGNGVFSRTNADEYFRALASKLHGDKLLVLRVKLERKREISAFAAAEETRLEELTPEVVFEERLKRENIADEKKNELRQTYAELVSLIRESEETV